MGIHLKIINIIVFGGFLYLFFCTLSFQYVKFPLQYFRDQSGVVKFYGSFAFNRKRNVLELEIKQDYTSPGTQKYVVSAFLEEHADLLSPVPVEEGLSNWGDWLLCSGFVLGEESADRLQSAHALASPVPDTSCGCTSGTIYLLYSTILYLICL